MTTLQYATQPNITAIQVQCLVFDKGMFDKGALDDPQSALDFCSSGNRKMVYVTKRMQEPSLLYIQGGKGVDSKVWPLCGLTPGE